MKCNQTYLYKVHPVGIVTLPHNGLTSRERLSNQGVRYVLPVIRLTTVLLKLSSTIPRYAVYKGTRRVLGLIFFGVSASFNATDSNLKSR